MLIDNHNRIIDYLRLAVTDKCNLRCFYCMPNEGISFAQKKALLSYEELIRIVRILAKEGVSKIRITGGEPFLRRELMSFLRNLSEIEGVEKIAITTNGTLTEPYLDELLELGIQDVNLSIDSIDAQRFYEITRRDVFAKVWACYHAMKERDFKLKLNCVVIKDRNIEDIVSMVALTENSEIAVRFIEEMPFNGTGEYYPNLEWDHERILSHIQEFYGTPQIIESPANSTSVNYRIPGFRGSFGIIPAFTRSFCGTCNRLRLTPTGTIKTCLYDQGVFNIRDFMRNGASDPQLLDALRTAIGNRAVDGFAAESNAVNRKNISESMANIGG